MSYATIGIADLTKLGLCTPDAVLPVPLPLCKHHYFLAKINVQTHCPMCNMSIRNSLLRSCPDSDSINSSTTQVGNHVRGNTPGAEQVDNSRERLEGGIGSVWRRAEHRL